jgi:hypothetical protein
VGDPHEKALNRWWAGDADKQIKPLLSPDSAKQWDRAREVFSGASEVLIGRAMPEHSDLNFDEVATEKRDGYLEIVGLIENEKFGEELPAVVVIPGTSAAWEGSFAVWISPQGKGALFGGEAGALAEPVRNLIDRGIAVLGVDLFGQGEFLEPGLAPPGNPQITYSKGKKLARDSWQRSPVYFYGYNHSIFARRVHDILSAVAFVRHHKDWKAKDVAVIGLEGAGHWVAAARAVAGGEISRAIIDTGGFRFADVPSEWDANFLPGAVKYGDLAGFLVQSAPHPLLLAGGVEEELKKQLQSTYRAAGASEALEWVESINPKTVAEMLGAGSRE